MSPTVITMDGWRSTVRSVRWSPVLVTPVACSIALVLVHAVSDPDPGRMASIGETALAFTAVAAAFVADDATLEAAPATPTEAPARLAARAVVTVPVTVLGWFLVLAVYGWSTPAAAAGAGDRALVGIGLGTAALALAALAGRLRSVESPGAVGVGAMAGLGAASVVVPAGWLEALPPGEVLWPVTIVLALVIVATATREPPR